VLTIVIRSFHSAFHAARARRARPPVVVASSSVDETFT
jgi:hypothetical protein